MLVLTRRIGERIVIDGDIEVMIIKCSGGQVTLGIDAPEEVDIVRAELLAQQE
jgi:carbon storage regulator